MQSKVTIVKDDDGNEIGYVTRDPMNHLYLAIIRQHPVPTVMETAFNANIFRRKGRAIQYVQEQAPPFPKVVG
jgi:hypothetical protein